ncbi:hypothetical protein AAMO2058_000224600 [Amorphochlora amoebiformis]
MKDTLLMVNERLSTPHVSPGLESSTLFPDLGGPTTSTSIPVPVGNFIVLTTLRKRHGGSKGRLAGPVHVLSSFSFRPYRPSTITSTF